MPPRTQRARFGALPSRIARSSTSCARPSISRKNSPGTSVGSLFATRRAWRRTTLRTQNASSSIASSDVTAVVTIVMTSATMIPSSRVEISSPGASAATSRIIAPLSTIAPRPSVSTVSGSASLITSGHSRPLTQADQSGRAERGPNVLDVDPRHAGR